MRGKSIQILLEQKLQGHAQNNTEENTLVMTHPRETLNESVTQLVSFGFHGGMRRAQCQHNYDFKRKGKLLCVQRLHV